MTLLAKQASGGVGWLHSSQISGLRHGKIKSPGPRTFVAIERLNFYLHRYLTNGLLIPNTPSSNSYAKGWAVTEKGEPPSVGWWVEVFSGYRVPSDFDLEEVAFTDRRATEFSESYGRLIRVLIARRGFDLIEELPQLIKQHYTAGDEKRVAKVTKVIRKEAVWEPEEIVYELPSLVALSAFLEGPTTEQELLDTLELK